MQVIGSCSIELEISMQKRIIYFVMSSALAALPYWGEHDARRQQLCDREKAPSFSNAVQPRRTCTSFFT